MNKSVVITGGAKGLGKQMAKNLTSKGFKVLIADSDKESLDKTCTELGIPGLLVDVTKEAELNDLLTKAEESFGQIDIWINNAATWLPRCKAEDLDMEQVKKMFDINVFGTIYGTQIALRKMKAQNSGTILNIISTSALMGRPLSSAYSASKHAVRGFTDSVREENKDSNIKILGAYPGGIKTNLFDEGKPDDFDDYMEIETVSAQIIDNLLQAEPEDNIIITKPGQEVGF